MQEAKNGVLVQFVLTDAHNILGDGVYDTDTELCEFPLFSVTWFSPMRNPSLPPNFSFYARTSKASSLVRFSSRFAAANYVRRSFCIWAFKNVPQLPDHFGSIARDTVTTRHSMPYYKFFKALCPRIFGRSQLSSHTYELTPITLDTLCDSFSVWKLISMLPSAWRFCSTASFAGSHLHGSALHENVLTELKQIIEDFELRNEEGRFKDHHDMDEVDYTDVNVDLPQDITTIFSVPTSINTQDIGNEIVHHNVLVQEYEEKVARVEDIYKEKHTISCRSNMLARELRELYSSICNIKQEIQERRNTLDYMIEVRLRMLREMASNADTIVDDFATF